MGCGGKTAVRHGQRHSVRLSDHADNALCCTRSCPEIQEQGRSGEGADRHGTPPGRGTGLCQLLGKSRQCVQSGNLFRAAAHLPDQPSGRRGKYRRSAVAGLDRKRPFGNRPGHGGGKKRDDHYRRRQPQQNHVRSGRRLCLGENRTPEELGQTHGGGRISAPEQFLSAIGSDSRQPAAAVQELPSAQRHEPCTGIRDPAGISGHH